jgi:hypothetical protein
MNFLSFLLALAFFGGADAKNLRASNAASREDLPAISSSRKLQSISEDIPTISSKRMLSSLTQDEKDRCYAIMDSTAVDDVINKSGYVEFLNLLAFGYLADNDITSFDDLSSPLKFAWITLSCQCEAMGGANNCCQADRAKLFVEGADGEPVSEEQTKFLNDVCKTAIETLGFEGWENPSPGEMPKPPTEDIDGEEIEQELPAKPTNPATDVENGRTPGSIIGMSVGIPLLLILLLLATLFFCRDKDYKPKEGEEEDEELTDVEKENVEEDSAIATVQTDAESSTVAGA